MLRPFLFAQLIFIVSPDLIRGDDGGEGGVTKLEKADIAS